MQHLVGGPIFPLVVGSKTTIGNVCNQVSLDCSLNLAPLSHLCKDFVRLPPLFINTNMVMVKFDNARFLRWIKHEFFQTFSTAKLTSENKSKYPTFGDSNFVC